MLWLISLRPICNERQKAILTITIQSQHTVCTDSWFLNSNLNNLFQSVLFQCANNTFIFFKLTQIFLEAVSLPTSGIRKYGQTRVLVRHSQILHILSINAIVDALNLRGRMTFRTSFTGVTAPEENQIVTSNIPTLRLVPVHKP